jgi:O-antigen ligase
VGAGAFQDAVEPLLSYYDDQHAYVAHNTFLSVLTELGIIGISLFLAVLACVLAAAFQITPRLERETWLIALGVWAVGVFTLTWENRKTTWIIFALILQSSAGSKAMRAVSGRLQNNHRQSV